jgi:acyl carrier protein
MMETFVLKLSEIVNEDISYLAEDRLLAEIPMWDSMSMLVFVALADQEYGKKLKSSQVKSAQTVGDLYDLLT